MVDRPTSDIPITISFNTSSMIIFLDLFFSAIEFLSTIQKR